MFSSAGSHTSSALRQSSALIALSLCVACPLNAEQNNALDGSVSVAPDVAEYTFSQGFPTGETAEGIYWNSDLRRAVEAYKIFLPTLATEAVIQQMVAAGARPNEIGIVMAQGPKQQFAATLQDDDARTSAGQPILVNYGI